MSVIGDYMDSLADPSVVEHWKARALTAEAECAELRRDVGFGCERSTTDHRACHCCRRRFDVLASPSVSAPLLADIREAVEALKLTKAMAAQYCDEGWPKNWAPRYGDGKGTRDEQIDAALAKLQARLP